MIYPYAQLADDPTSKIYISWIDVGSNTGATQTLQYRKVGDSDYETVTSDGLAVPNASGEWKYEVLLTGLKNNTEYEGNIQTGEDTKAIRFKTLPTRLWRSDLKVFVLSDIHIDSRTPGGMQNGNEMAEVRALSPDILVINGDVVTWGYEGNPAGTAMSTLVNDWIAFFSNHVDSLNGTESYLVPMVLSPGNHEVGNSSGWTGVGEVYPTLGFIQFFFSNVKDIPPIGKNYGIFTVGNYLNILALDSHSAEAAEIGSWLDTGVFRDNGLLTLSFQHNPLLPTGSRVSEDLINSENMRNAYGHRIFKARTTRVCFGGHIHTDKRTKELTVVSNEPQSGDFISLGGNGYLVEAQAGDKIIVEYGEGYRSNRSAVSRWYDGYSLGGDDSYNTGFLVTIDDSAVQVDTLRFRTGLVRSEEYTTARIISADALALASWM